ncbi:MAG TPA: hypothetical protein DEH25_05730 [Chloroflexi bacterium]|nr:hypothetical protein [Chloroflexota bacterium]
MKPETNLEKLLATMEPELHPGEFAFATVSSADFEEMQAGIWGWFREPEGITLIGERSALAATGLETTFPCRMITLKVHSALEAVGFLAIITAKLAAAGISTNAISAYYHDHLFVPVGRADDAMQVLQRMMAVSNKR